MASNANVFARIDPSSIGLESSSSGVVLMDCKHRHPYGSPESLFHDGVSREYKQQKKKQNLQFNFI